VRIKNTGPYNGDIALVVTASDTKVWVRLIPRIDLTVSAKKDKTTRKFIRPPQKLNFRPTAEMGATHLIKWHSELNRNVTLWNKQLFYNGFVFKQFPFKQIDTSSDIKPNHEEIQNF
jgi:hypothetical protein